MYSKLVIGEIFVKLFVLDKGKDGSLGLVGE